MGYRPATPDWQGADTFSRLALGSRDGQTCYLRQAFEAEEGAAALYLELLTEREVEIYLNGELVCRLDALNERPPAWRSAGGSYSIDSPVLHLGLNQRLVRKGRNVLALQVRVEGPPGWESNEYIALRRLERRQESSSASSEEEARRR